MRLQEYLEKDRDRLLAGLQQEINSLSEKAYAERNP